jgi:hypothetical protein
MLYSVNLLERSHLPITLVHAQKRNVDNFDRIPVCCPSAFIYLEPIVSVNKGIYFRSQHFSVLWRIAERNEPLLPSGEQFNEVAQRYCWYRRREISLTVGTFVWCSNWNNWSAVTTLRATVKGVDKFFVFCCLVVCVWSWFYTDNKTSITCIFSLFYNVLKGESNMNQTVSVSKVKLVNKVAGSRSRHYFFGKGLNCVGICNGCNRSCFNF